MFSEFTGKLPGWGWALPQVVLSDCEREGTHCMTIGADKDCQLVSKAFEAALFELERLSERPGRVPVKSTDQRPADEPVALAASPVANR
jgi:hypothetical protein